ncbi:unnamed protein product [Vicia faba]|uniref:Uncharacterized protein n=1 Tax=Vicia faba TaxID=3906 RepID=A0AAV0ZMI1_VICFA|nr:unnamed protein product [Vicia faba]
MEGKGIHGGEKPEEEDKVVFGWKKGVRRMFVDFSFPRIIDNMIQGWKPTGWQGAASREFRSDLPSCVLFTTPPDSCGIVDCFGMIYSGFLAEFGPLQVVVFWTSL